MAVDGFVVNNFSTFGMVYNLVVTFKTLLKIVCSGTTTTRNNMKYFSTINVQKNNLL